MFAIIWKSELSPKSETLLVIINNNVHIKYKLSVNRNSPEIFCFFERFQGVLFRFLGFSPTLPAGLVATFFQGFRSSQCPGTGWAIPTKCYREKYYVLVGKLEPVKFQILRAAADLSRGTFFRVFA